ncbi:hypothetical protein KKF84_19705 [Myxococcota bacterium]|nr:hypothetical protein [Myxococcota bacterium]MBU1537550.1 hypothetical protein [Myxococcota bacterium]
MRSVLLISLLATALGVCTAQGAKRSNAFIKRLKTVKDFNFQDYSVSSERYIIDSPASYKLPTRVYDAKLGKISTLPMITSLPGLPGEPQLKYGKGYRYRKAALVNSGRYWRWYSKEYIWYDGVKNVAGIWFVKETISKNNPGAPSCPSGGTARLVAKFGMYYCNSDARYLKTAEYTTTKRESLFALVDLTARRVKWIRKVADGQYKPLGVDKAGEYVYAGIHNYRWKGKMMAPATKLTRLSLTTKQVDWTYTLKTPPRTKNASAASYSIPIMASPDFTHFFVWEYDEAHYKKKRGWLKNPYPRGWVINRVKNSRFVVEAPVTCYGRAFDPSGKYLMIGSHQLGTMYRVNLETKKIDKQTTTSNKTYKYVFSDDGKHLFGFNFWGVTVHAFPSLKKIATVKLSALYPRAGRLLVVERVLPIGKNRVVMGILKEHKLSKTWSSEKDKGFVIFKLK